MTPQSTIIYTHRHIGERHTLHRYAHRATWIVEENGKDPVRTPISLDDADTLEFSLVLTRYYPEPTDDARL